jgi:G:T-mismatch repair DNA endonuclease (very short patch repair protein)
LYPDLCIKNFKEFREKYPKQAHAIVVSGGKRCNELYPDVWKKNLETFCDFPNYPESYLLAIIQNHNLHYQYTGDWRYFIGNHNPDFISTNDTNVVIEFFGEYWHPPDDEEIYIKHYAQYGFKCIIIWEHELQELSELEIVKKIKEFTKEEKRLDDV